MLSLQVNGELQEIKSDPDTPLVYVLRNELKLKGTKIGCGLEQCGACAVLVDGQATFSCVTPASSFSDSDIVTVEGVSQIPAGRQVQEAFIAHRAAQCGYCTAGLVVAVTALKLENTGKRDRNALKMALSEYLCRCGSHPRVLSAAAEVLEQEV
ncbi:MAG: 2Fe-2S iron-sulfur cluster-binding protein [Pseudomonadota bacterium]